MLLFYSIYFCSLVKLSTGELHTWSPTEAYTQVLAEIESHPCESVGTSTNNLTETTWKSAEPSSSPSSPDISTWNSGTTSNISFRNTTAHSTSTKNTTANSNGSRNTSAADTITESAGSYTYFTPTTVHETASSIHETASSRASGAIASSSPSISLTGSFSVSTIPDIASPTSLFSTITSRTDTFVTSTVTTVPPDFWIETIHPGMPSYGWVTTTQSDHSSTVVPIVDGNILFNLPPWPHVEFSLPRLRLPDFSLPCIKVLSINTCDSSPTPISDDESTPGSDPPPPPPPGNTEKPTQSDGEQPSSTSSCRTASECRVSCSIASTSHSQTYTDCFNTACLTVTSCNAVDTTTTTLLSGSCPLTFAPPSPTGAAKRSWEKAPPGCNVGCPDVSEWDAESGDSDLGDPDEWSDDEDSNSLSQFLDNWLLAGSLPPMKARPITTLGLTGLACAITDSLKVPGAAHAVTTPSYPPAMGLLRYETSGLLTGSADVFSRWLKTTDDGSCRYSIMYVSATQILSDSASIKATHTGAGGIPGDWEPSLDHIYENNWLHRFAGSFLDPSASSVMSSTGPVDKLNCPDFLALVYGGTSGKRTRNLLIRVSDSLAGWEHLADMVGMSRGANGYVKSFVMTVPRFRDSLDEYLGRDWEGTPGDSWEDQTKKKGLKSKLQMKLRFWKQTYLAMQVINLPELLAATQRTNLRMYNAWLQNDKDLACEQVYQDKKWSFAPKYIDFIESYTHILTSRGELRAKIIRLVFGIYHDSLLAFDMVRRGILTDNEFEEYLECLALYDGLSESAHPYKLPDDFWRWKIEWNWPEPVALDDAPACTLTYSQSSTSIAVTSPPSLTSRTTQAITHSGAASSPTRPPTVSTLSTSPVFSTDRSSLPQPSYTPTTATASSCLEDSQCSSACPTGEVSHCSVYGIGSYAYGSCVCILSSTLTPHSGWHPKLSLPPWLVSSSSSPSSLPSSSPLSSSPLPPPPPPPLPSTPQANCNFWDSGFGWKFEVFNIIGWATDGGADLRSHEEGCGALTGWTWKDTDSGSQAFFYLPFFMKEGCVEDAIVAAGGPRIQCQGRGLGDDARYGEWQHTTALNVATSV